MPSTDRRGKILLATRNEMVTLPLVLEEIAEAVQQLSGLGWHLSVVIVDDSDVPEVEQALPDLCHRLGLDIELVQGWQRGLGAAIIQGFRHCLLDERCDFVINLDADGQHDARQMGDLLRIFAATDSGVTIGSRWTNGGRCYGLSFPRKVISRCSSLALRFSGVPFGVKDPTTSFRVYRRDAAEIISREVMGFNGFSFFGAGVAVAAAHGLLVNETPIHFRPRVGGQSNLSLRQTLRAVRDLPRIRAHWSMVKRREKAFERIVSDPKAYTASRELEQLANTPVSTGIILDELESHVGRRVLEIGAGLGLITESLINRQREVTALEPDAGLFSHLQANDGAATARRFDTTLHEWPHLATEAGTFDTVLYVNVLEHIKDDVGELVTASRACRSGGNIVVFVPAGPSLYGSMDWISAHFRRYRMKELEAVAKSAGLRIVDIRYFDTVGKFPYWLMYRVLKKRSLGSGAVGVYDKVIVPLSARLPRSFTRIVGGKNLILVAQPA